MTCRPHHSNIAAGLYCLTTSPGFLPTLCKSGFFYVHRVFLSYTQDWWLKVSSDKLGNEDKAPCPRTILPCRGSNRGLPVYCMEVCGLNCLATTARFNPASKPTFYPHIWIIYQKMKINACIWHWILTVHHYTKVYFVNNCPMAGSFFAFLHYVSVFCSTFGTASNV